MLENNRFIEYKYRTNINTDYCDKLFTAFFVFHRLKHNYQAGELNCDITFIVIYKLEKKRKKLGLAIKSVKSVTP